jgi:hypothetical protein
MEYSRRKLFDDDEEEDQRIPFPLPLRALKPGIPIFPNRARTHLSTAIGAIIRKN